MTSDNGPSGALGPFETPLYKMFEPELPFFHYPLVAADSVEEAIGVLTEHFGAEKKDGLWQGGALKLFADGTFGSRTAMFSEDYSDRPGERGYLGEQHGRIAGSYFQGPRGRLADRGSCHWRRGH